MDKNYINEFLPPNEDKDKGKLLLKDVMKTFEVEIGKVNNEISTAIEKAAENIQPGRRGRTPRAAKQGRRGKRGRGAIGNTEPGTSIRKHTEPDKNKILREVNRPLPPDAMQPQRLYRMASIENRIRLLTENVALSNLGEPNILSDMEFKQIFYTIRTNREWSIYDKYKKAEANTRIAIGLLTEQRNKYEAEIAYISGYCLLWNEYNSFKEILYHVAKTIGGPRGLHYLDYTEELNKLLYAKFKKQGDVLTIEPSSPEGDKTIFKLLPEHKERAESVLREFKTLYTAVLDMMKNKNIVIRPYTNKINELKDEISSIKPTGYNKGMRSDFYSISEFSDIPMDMNYYNELILMI